MGPKISEQNLCSNGRQLKAKKVSSSKVYSVSLNIRKTRGTPLFLTQRDALYDFGKMLGSLIVLMMMLLMIIMMMFIGDALSKIQTILGTLTPFCDYTDTLWNYCPSGVSQKIERGMLSTPEFGGNVKNPLPVGWSPDIAGIKKSRSFILSK